MATSVFKSMLHDHYFYDIGNETVMIDHFYYKTPLGLIGEVANLIFIKRYLTHLLTQRNEIIRGYAESDNWKNILLTNKQVESIVC